MTVATHPIRRRIDAAAEWLSRRSWLSLTLGMVITSLIMCFTLLGQTRESLHWTMNIVENWGAIERVALWQDWLRPVIPTFTLSRFVVEWSFRLAFLAQFGLQVAAFLAVMRSPRPRFWRWMTGPLLAHLIQFFLMAPTNSDVFFYMTVGDFAKHGYNPYISELLMWPDHPLIPFNYWVDIGTVYGPQWVNYNLIVARLFGADPITTTLAQKALAGIVAIALAWTIYRFALRLAAGNQRIAVAAAMLVAWQPNMILESSGQVHNDFHTVFIATLGLVIVVLGGIRGVRGGLILVAFSAMIKFVTLPLLGVLAILRLVDRKKPHGIAVRILGNWVLDGIGIVAVVVGGFLPWWAGPRTLAEMAHEPDRLYTHPLWRAIQGSLTLLFGWNHGAKQWTAVSRPMLKYGAMLGAIAVVIWLGYQLWTSRQLRSEPNEDPLTDDALPWWTRPLLYAWMLEFMLLSYVTVNSHPWYWIWPVSAVAQVLAFEYRRVEQFSVRMIPNWVWLYLIFNAAMTLGYHTRIAHF